MNWPPAQAQVDVDEEDVEIIWVVKMQVHLENSEGGRQQRYDRGVLARL